MTSDGDADVVYISDLLEPRYPVLVERLRGTLSDHGIPLREIRRTRDYWCRDYMPLAASDGTFVQFRYSPDYLQGYERLITRPSDLAPISEIVCRQTEIILDGGNVVRWGGRCIMTDKVFRENSGIEESELIARLRDLLRVDELIVIPVEPYDEAGHSDGVVRFLDAGTVVINAYADVSPSYGKRLKAILHRAGLQWVELPYKPKPGKRGQMPPAFGCYVNLLRVLGLIVVPIYGIPQDDEACKIIEQNASGSRVVPLNCRQLSMQGGVLNCVTWTFNSQEAMHKK